MSTETRLWEEPACLYGYTDEQAARVIGTRLEAFRHWHRGQTGALCDGRTWVAEARTYVPSNCGPHGAVVYPHDVERFLMGLPNDD